MTKTVNNEFLKHKQRISMGERRLLWLGLTADRSPMHTTTSVILGDSMVTKRTGLTENKHIQERFAKDVIRLGKDSSSSSSQQTRMASEVGPMYPLGQVSK